MSIEAPQEYDKAVSEVRNVAYDFTPLLDEGESLTGTPTVTITPSGPTVSNAAVNVAALTILGETVAIGKAVQFRVSGGSSGVTYTFTISVATNSTPAQTLRRKGRLNLVAD